MRQQRKSKKISFGKNTLISIRIQIDAILDAMHNTNIEVVGLKPVARNEGNFVLAQYHCVCDPETRRSRLFAVARFGDLCDVWLAGPESGESQNDAA